ncbi:hypothetical protein BC831DRAFT_460932 [Entophlyctis helioformis]|nr:hypothetical protein BC831DRAFT_460932 [Entophlyctis helioformis]
MEPEGGNPWTSESMLAGRKTSESQAASSGMPVPSVAPNTIDAAHVPRTAIPMSMDAADDRERSALISQALDLQEALLTAIQRVDKSRTEYNKLRGENQMLLEYINNLMSATNATTPSSASAPK